MLAKRIIPCLDIADGRVVKGVNFINLRDAGDPAELAERYANAGADEIVLLDISASAEGRNAALDVLRRATERVFLPVTLGGGMRTVADMRAALLAGADKVGVNSAAVANPDFITQGAKIFGRQCVVLAIDAKLTGATLSGWEVVTHGGRTPTGIDAVVWAQEGERLGAGEILLTSMDCDGTLDGYDLPLTSAITSAVGIPVIASGGAGSPAHMVDVLQKTGADAALAASIFHDGTYTVGETKAALAAAGLAVRQ
jgi:imidazole glycerol-phosphate synthase subunit HisF